MSSSSSRFVKCSICMECYKPGDNIFASDCGHVFHFSCLKQWQTQSKKCPNCRKLINNTIKLYLDFVGAENSRPSTSRHSQRNSHHQHNYISRSRESNRPCTSRASYTSNSRTNNTRDIQQQLNCCRHSGANSEILELELDLYCVEITELNDRIEQLMLRNTFLEFLDE